MWDVLLFVLVLLVLIFSIVALIDGNRFVVRDYTVENSKLKKAYTFVLLSDLHDKAYGRENMELFEAIDAIHPDSVIVAGDMINGRASEDFQNAADLLQQISEKYRVYYGNGNHETRLRLYPDCYGSMYENYMNVLFSMGICPLCNESVYLPDVNINITGLEMNQYYYKKFGRKPMEDEYLTALMGKPRVDCMQILIAHNPEYFEKYAGWGADLTLAGHIHGGIINLPKLGGVLSPSFRLFPRYDGGLFEEFDKTMILSRGLGTHTIPVRIFNPGELVVVHLKVGK